MVSGLYFQTDIHSAPDFVYAMEVYGRIQNFCYLNRPLYCYYINSGSYTRVFELKKYSEFKRVRKLLWDHMYEWGCDSEFDKRHYATRWICNAMTLIKVALLESDWSMRHDCIQKIRSIVFDDEFQLQQIFLLKAFAKQIYNRWLVATVRWADVLKIVIKRFAIDLYVEPALMI